jgi:hypothetical protein
MHLNGELDSAKRDYEVELTKSRNIAIDQKSKVYRMQQERDEALNLIKGKELEITRLMQSNQSLRLEHVDKDSYLNK